MSSSVVVIARALSASERARGRARGGNAKVVIFVRHAEGTHNVTGYNDEKNADARLTARGVAQCEGLAMLSLASARDGAEVLVVTSSMTRCAQTARLGFPHLARRHSGVKWIAREEVRETVNYWCDRRRAIGELSREFNEDEANEAIDFSSCPAEDEIWAKYEAMCGPPEAWVKHRESGDLCAVANRARAFFAWLETRPEEVVVVSSHSAFLRAMFSYGHPEGVRGAPEQIFSDVKDTALGVPVVNYVGDGTFERAMRADFENCEHRACVIEFA